ncbi:MAG: acyltransferase family protein [Hyphomicrobiales bacterium]
MAQQRVDWVDAAKGICIIFVVMMHSTLGVEKAVGETNWMHIIVAFAAPFRMPDFFLISGLFLAAVLDRNWRKYVDLKVIHFFYFYALWVTIQFLFKAPGMASEFGIGGTALLYLKSYIEPFGTLWFIYILPIFFVLTKAAHDLHIPLWMTGLFAALMHLSGLHTDWHLANEFASRYVFFFAGYALAPLIFRIAEWARHNMSLTAVFLLVWALINGGLVWARLASSPVFSLPLGFAGAVALICVASLMMEMRLSAPIAWLATPITWLGANSIVIYLAFFLPMAITRSILLKTGIIPDLGTVSILVTTAGVVGPAIFYLILKRLNIALFLFERPAWARISHTAPSPNSQAAMKPGE